MSVKDKIKKFQEDLKKQNQEVKEQYMSSDKELTKYKDKENIIIKNGHVSNQLGEKLVGKKRDANSKHVDMYHSNISSKKQKTHQSKTKEPSRAQKSESKVEISTNSKISHPILDYPQLKPVDDSKPISLPDSNQTGMPIGMFNKLKSSSLIPKTLTFSAAELDQVGKRGSTVKENKVVDGIVKSCSSNTGDSDSTASKSSNNPPTGDSSFTQDLFDDIRHSLALYAEHVEPEDDQLSKLLQDLLEDSTRHGELIEKSKQIHELSLQLEKDVENDVSSLVCKYAVPIASTQYFELFENLPVQYEDLPSCFLDDYTHTLLY